MARQAQPRGQTAGVSKRGNKINLEAYEAYHNNGKDNALLLSQTQSEEVVKDSAVPNHKNEIVSSPKTGEESLKGTAKETPGDTKGGKEGKGAKGVGSPTTVTTNNYTTVMQNGANINITNINNHHTYLIYR